jgi:hypothetical protein
MYTDGLPRSPLAVDPLYVVGDASAALPIPEHAPEPANPTSGAVVVTGERSAIAKTEEAAKALANPRSAGQA